MKPPKTYTLLPASAEDVYKLIDQFGPGIATIMIAGTIEDLPFPLHPRSAELPAGPIHVVKIGEAYWLLVERTYGGLAQFVAVPASSQGEPA